MKLLMLYGIPASGKSTYARKLVEQGNWVRVNKDDLRDQLHNGKWSRANEKIILKARDAIIEVALRNGQNVVVDDTNLHKMHQETFRALAANHGADFDMKFFYVTVEEAIERDLNRERTVGEHVIRTMVSQLRKLHAQETA